MKRNLEALRNKASGPSNPTLLKWRLVASTHRLEDLLENSATQTAGSFYHLIVGLFLIALSMLAVTFASVYLLPAMLLPWASHAQRQEWSSPDSKAYYTQAVAAWFPVTALYVFVNWFCNKLFKHNT
jgi:hypothetical protein